MNEQINIETPVDPAIPGIPAPTVIPGGPAGTEERIFVQTPEDVGTETIH